MKKVCCLGLLMCLCLCLCSGCSRQENVAGNEPVQLNVLQYELENVAVDFNNLWYYGEIESQTGVHVAFEDVKDSEWDSRVSLAMGKGSMPDMILRGSLDIEEYGVSRHLLIPLEPYMEQGLLPNYTARMEASGLREQMTASDGHIYELGFLISQGVNTNGHFFINHSWLEALSLPVPQTVEELTETLRHFRDDDPNGNGISDEIPMEFTLDDNITGIYNVFSFFGLALNEDYVTVLPDGTVCFAPLEPAFLETARWLHELYKEHLLDVDFISQGSNIWAAKVNTGNVGMFSYWRLQNTALRPEIAQAYQLLIPVHTDGRKACLPRNMDIIEFGAALTTDNRDVEASLRWLDAQFETENMLVSQNGKVGDTLKKRGDGRYEVVYVPENNELYQTVPVICGQFFAPETYYASVYVPAEHRLEKAGYCSAYENAGVLEPVSCKLLTTVAPRTADEDRQLIKLKRRLKAVVDEQLVNLVTQGVTEESGRILTEQLKAAGCDEYTAIYQNLYDRYRKE
ncbi:MAG: extracellular solute-binding protein [Clostridia bacterium]|nr:extracellular solute-binding protein [Clostridia bacterium]